MVQAPESAIKNYAEEKAEDLIENKMTALTALFGSILLFIIAGYAYTLIRDAEYDTWRSPYLMDKYIKLFVSVLGGMFFMVYYIYLILKS